MGSTFGNHNIIRDINFVLDGFKNFQDEVRNRLEDALLDVAIERQTAISRSELGEVAINFLKGEGGKLFMKQQKEKPKPIWFKGIIEGEDLNEKNFPPQTFTKDGSISLAS